ncbi:MAG TPA: lysyl oxidase family protein [Candidatus Polarisedimenticolia bacterium]|nr:lysyl oxidase family protein [Candidatus Polarisedimenticolia bacterium]
MTTRVRRYRIALVGVLIALALTTAAATAANKPSDPCPGGLEPNLQATVPHHLGIQNTNGREYLRLDNAIANTGAGPWHLHPETVLAGEGGTTTAIQDIWSTIGGAGDPASQIVCSFATTQFAFHQAHNHWHIGSVAQFSVLKANDNGTAGSFGAVYVNDLGVAQSFKTTFCLIDWIKLEDNSKTPERVYWACDRTAPFQGVSVGWVDQYHHQLEGQEVDITAAPVGIYYLTINVNDERKFIESDYTDNGAWVSFGLTRDSKGNPKVTLISHSPCSSPNMCGEALPNR